MARRAEMEVELETQHRGMKERKVKKWNRTLLRRELKRRRVDGE